MLRPLDPLTKWERLGLALLLLVALAFGGIVLLRSAFLKRRMTDLGVYLRAAWAVRSGADLYAITDENGWHYLYPPLFAVALIPLADSPPGASMSYAVPFAVSVIIWYLLNLAMLSMAVHVLASALEQSFPPIQATRAPPGCRRWWWLRVTPILICLPTIGHTLARSQINILLLTLLCAMTAAAIRGHSWSAGFWLSSAICLHVIPVYLLLYPIWRKDTRWLAGTAVGLMIGLLLIPALVMGPQKTLTYLNRYVDVMLTPALTEGGEKSRFGELHAMTATDNQSPLAIWHHARYWRLDREERPPYPDLSIRVLHYLIGALLTISIFAAAFRSSLQDAPSIALTLGLLSGHMLVVSPFSHRHHFALAVLLILCLQFIFLENPQQGRQKAAWYTLWAVYIIATALPLFDEFAPLKYFGLVTYAWFLLAGVATIILWRRSRSANCVPQHEATAPAILK